MRQSGHGAGHSRLAALLGRCTRSCSPSAYQASFAAGQAHLAQHVAGQQCRVHMPHLRQAEAQLNLDGRRQHRKRGAVNGRGRHGHAPQQEHVLDGAGMLRGGRCSGGRPGLPSICQRIASCGCGCRQLRLGPGLAASRRAERRCRRRRLRRLPAAAGAGGHQARQRLAGAPCSSTSSTCRCYCTRHGSPSCQAAAQDRFVAELARTPFRAPQTPDGGAAVREQMLARRAAQRERTKHGRQAGRQSAGEREPCRPSIVAHDSRDHRLPVCTTRRHAALAPTHSSSGSAACGLQATQRQLQRQQHSVTAAPSPLQQATTGPAAARCHYRRRRCRRHRRAEQHRALRCTRALVH